MQTMTALEIEQVAGGAADHLATFLSLLSTGQGYGDPAAASEAIRFGLLREQVRKETAATLTALAGKLG